MAGVASVGSDIALQAGKDNPTVNSDFGATGNTAFAYFVQDIQNQTFAPGETEAATTENQSINLTQEAEVPSAGADYAPNSGSTIVRTQEFTQSITRVVTNDDGSKEVYTENTEAFVEATGDADNRPTTNIDVNRVDAPKPEPKAEVAAPKPEPKAEAPASKPEPKAEAPAPKPEPKAEAPAPKPEPKADVAEPKAEPKSPGTIRFDVPRIVEPLPVEPEIISKPVLPQGTQIDGPTTETFEQPAAPEVEVSKPMPEEPAPAPYAAPAPYVAPAKPEVSNNIFSFASSSSSTTSNTSFQSITIGKNTTVTESATSSISFGGGSNAGGSSYSESFIRTIPAREY